jgi:hypothetical protein
MSIRLHVKYPLFLPDSNQDRIFKADLKSPQILNVTKIRPVGHELFRADGRTNTITLIFAFLNFAKAPKIQQPLRLQILLICILFWTVTWYIYKRGWLRPCILIYSVHNKFLWIFTSAINKQKFWSQVVEHEKKKINIIKLLLRMTATVKFCHLLRCYAA